MQYGFRSQVYKSLNHILITLDLSAFYWCFLKNGWFTSYLIVARSFGFFCRQRSKKSLTSALTNKQEGILIQSLTIFINSYSRVILNGFSPTTISYIIIPIDQISIFSSYSLPLRIYGHTQRGVPQKVVLNLLS